MPSAAQRLTRVPIFAASFHSTVLPQYSRASSVQLDEYDDSKHSLWEADVGVSRFVPSNGGRDVCTFPLAAWSPSASG